MVTRQRTLAAFAFLIVAAAVFAQPFTIHETALPAGSFPTGITAGPDGNLWFGDNGKKYVGRLTPAGVFTPFAFPVKPFEVQSIAPGPDGALWFTEGLGDKVGRITTSGTVTEYPTAGLRPDPLVAGPDGAMWFAESSRIGRVAIAAPNTVTEFGTTLQPGSIALGSDGNIWFTDNSNSVSKIVRIDLTKLPGCVADTTVCMTNFPVPTANSNLLGIALGPDGALWFCEAQINKIGRITTAGAITEYSIPTPNSFTNNIALGPDGALWFTEFSGNKIGRITIAGVVTETPIPTANASPRGIVAGPDGNVWFTESQPGKIGTVVTGVGACQGADGQLCLVNGRFKVQTTWTDQHNNSGAGHAVSLTGNAGYFWFFSSTNVEMVVKALDACGVNDNFWVFAGGLTNVNVVMTVTDTYTGKIKQYVNPQNTAFQPIQDTGAFSTCPAAALANLDERSSSSLAPQHVPWREVTAGGCANSASALCLNGSRFLVEASWQTPDGRMGQGTAVPLTADSGYFWFFSADNIELVVKVLDGCPVNTKQWVFSTGLTNVLVNLKITDTQTGKVQTYVNPQGAAYQPVQDTSAFSDCP
jgi:virginiamycin B lyase